MRVRYTSAIALTVLTACVVPTSAQRRGTRSTPLVRQPSTPLLAEQLERAGLTSEAATEAARALPASSGEERTRYIALLNRLRDRRTAVDLAQRNAEFSKRLAIGDQLASRGLQEDARREYVSAAEGAVSSDQRDLALAAAERTRKTPILDSGSGDRIRNAIRTIFDSGVAALAATVVLGAIWLVVVRPALAGVKRVRQRFSKRALVLDFQDGTSTGLGRGLPALIRTLHREQQQFQAVPPGGSVLVPYMVPGGLPVLSAPSAETDFSWAGLSVAGAPLKHLLAQWSTAWHAPWSTTTGTIYQLNQDVRLSVSVVTSGEQTVAWDASLQDGVNPPRDAAYRVLFTILDQWERRNG